MTLPRGKAQLTRPAPSKAPPGEGAPSGADEALLAVPHGPLKRANKPSCRSCTPRHPQCVAAASTPPCWGADPEQVALWTAPLRIAVSRSLASQTSLSSKLKAPATNHSTQKLSHRYNDKSRQMCYTVRNTTERRCRTMMFFALAIALYPEQSKQDRLPERYDSILACHRQGEKRLRR